MSNLQEEIFEEPLGIRELPNGWKFALMGDIAKIVGGGTPKASDDTNFSEDGFPWITPADLSGFNGTYIERGRRSLSEKGLKSCSAMMMPKGTVLMSSRAPIGYVAIAANPVCTNQGFKSFICQSDIVHEYVFYWLRFIKPLLEKMGSGTTFLEISGARASQIPILVPPTAEQKRIVAKIEELLPRVNAVRERLIRVKEIMKRFRQSVLAAACSGQLTEDWREKCSDPAPPSERVHTLATAECQKEDLSPSRQEEKRNGGAIPSGWRILRLREILTDLKYGTSKKCTQEAIGLPVLRIPNVIKGHIDHTEMKFAELGDREYEQLKLREGDILMVRSNGSPALLGRTAVVTETERGFAYAGYLIRLRPDTKRISPAFLNVALSSQEIRTQIELPMRSTSGVHNINSREVGNLEFPLPPFEEQVEIVCRVESLFKLADKIEKRVESEFSRTGKMTQAILAKAFRGELVPTEASSF